VLLWLAGCDGVFGLGHVHDPPVDATPVDVPVDTLDAVVCVPATQHDEDGDGQRDDRDACPTVPNDTADSDGDGLPNDCDPGLSTSIDGDKIILASVFASTSELSTNYTQGGTANPMVVSDQLVLESGAIATTVMTMTPTKIVASVSQFTTVNATPQTSDRLTIGINGAVCSVATSGCAGEQNRICIALGPSTTHVALASNINQVTLWKDTAGTHCEVRLKVAGGPFVNTSTGTITSSKGFARVEGNAAASLSSLVFYGEK
jgi:hypothetical protein